MATAAGGVSVAGADDVVTSNDSRTLAFKSAAATVMQYITTYDARHARVMR